MKILQHYTLEHENTFGVAATTPYFVSVESIEQLKEVLKDVRFQNPFILGGGSNLLFTKNLTKPVVKIEIGGIEIIDETEKEVTIEVGAGVVWHDLVMWSLEQGWSGLENLALIPGSVGAAPIQNIGAYGSELCDTFRCCRLVDEKGNEKILEKNDCQFGYRSSIFKTSQNSLGIIVQVQFTLQKPPHKLQTEYGAIETSLKSKGISEPTPKDVANAVIEIRQAKLPDPKVLGNSGSFFKNPIIDTPKAERLRVQYPNIPLYAHQENYKVAAAWLIEQCGWKGKRVGAVGMHAQQALVLVNYGGASGKELWTHAKRVQASVKARFDILLQPEVNLI